MAMVVGAQDPCAGAGQAVVDDAVIDYPPGADTYAANMNCVWRLSCSDPNLTPVVAFSSYRFADAGDYVAAFDGTTASSSLRFFQQSGNTVPSAVAFGVNEGLLQFISNSNNYRSTGFRATVACPANPCSGAPVEIVDSGSIRFPQGSEYGSNLDCRWTVGCSDWSFGPVVTFQSFGTEAYQDYVNAYDGETAAVGARIVQVSGSATPSPILFSPDKVSLLQFTSDATTAGAGFAASVTCVAHPCGDGVTLHNGGQVDFPASELAYDNNLNCMWTLSCPGVSVPLVTFTSFEVGDPSDEEDFVAAYNGESSDAERLARLSGTYEAGAAEFPEPLEFSTGTGLLEFNSGPSGRFPGFEATVTCVTHPCAGDGEVIAGGGSVDYPPGDGNYLGDKTCKWILTCQDDSVPLVTFTDFATELGYDFVNAYDGISTDSDRVARRSGDGVPGPILFRSSEGLLEFSSDQSVAAHGFEANVGCVSPVIIGYTSFEESTIVNVSPIPIYVDTLHMVDHELTQTVGSNPISYTRCTGGQNELGFLTFYSASGGVGLSDGDSIGVVGDSSTVMNGQAGVAKDGQQYYMLEDTDGFVWVAMDFVDVASHGNVKMKCWIYAEEADWADGSDLLKVWAMDERTQEEVILINQGNLGATTFRDIDGFMHVQGRWNEFGEELPNFSAVSMRFGLTTNDKRVFFDYFRLLGVGPDQSARLCLSCVPGYYADSVGEALCAACPAGRFVPIPGSVNATACEDCQTGQYAGPGSSSCAFCSSGRADEDDDPATECTECTAGTYAGCGETRCSECIPGQVDSDSSSATPCTACLPGQYWQGAVGGSSSSCIQCSAGQADTDEDSTTACVDCTIGTYAAVGSALCASCLSTGQYDDDRNPATPCSDTDICVQICEAGTQDSDCDDSTDCVTCRPGQYAAGGLAFPASRCQDCVPGKTDDDSDPASACVSCSPGYYAETGNNGICIGCPLGKFAPTAGGASATACEDCQTGQYAGPGSSSCTFCSSGRADEDDDPATECTECAAGTYAGCGETRCSECIPGQVDSDSSSATPCTACLPGQYWDAGNASSLSACIQCSAGQADTDEDSTTACVACRQGEFCSAGATVVIDCEEIGQADLDNDPATPCVAAKHTDAAVHATLRLTGNVDDLPSNFEDAFALDVSRIIGVEPARIQHVVSVADSQGRRRMQVGGVVVQFVVAPAPDGVSIPISVVHAKFASPNSTVVGLIPQRLTEAEMQSYECGQQCPRGSSDHDCDSATDCLQCPPGRYSAGGTSPGALCTQCPIGQSDHDNDPTSPCQSCVPGKYTESTAHRGKCIECEAGRFNPNAGATSIENCEECKTDEQSEAGAADCEPPELFFSCDDPSRQVSDFERYHVMRKGCSCKPGYYNAAAIEIRCWEMAYKKDVKLDMLNEPSWLDIELHNRVESRGRLYWPSTCVKCPKCMDCSTTSDWDDIKIKEGYGLVAESVANFNRTFEDRLSKPRYMDVFQCPLFGSCLEGLTLGDLLRGKTRACGQGYDSDPASPLCASCDDGYARYGRSCSPCDEVRGGSIAIAVVLFVALFAGVMSTLRLRSFGHQFQVMAALLRLIWPRLQQSANLLITNYQILSGLSERVQIQFPAMITTVLRALSTLVSIDILNLPGLACLTGSSFYVKFLSTMLSPLIVVVGLRLAARMHIERLRTVTMPMPPELDVDPDSVGPKGSDERRRLLHRTSNFKICRAVVASKVQAPYNSLICFVVFFRFPAVSRIIFAMFRCRRVAEDPNSVPNTINLLEAAYDEQCFQGDHWVFLAIGIFFLVAYTIGIPAWLLYKLTLFKDTIVGKPPSSGYRPAIGKPGDPWYRPEVGDKGSPGNPNYIEIAPFKPLFQFLKPQCYRFEVYFWIEKVLLVGFAELFASIVQDNTGIAQWFLNMTFTITYLVLVAKYEPCTEPRYNFGNILMHIMILYFFILTLLLNPRLDIKESAVANLKLIDISLVISQIVLVVYLVFVSFQKIARMWNDAKRQVAAEQLAEQRLKDHLTEVHGSIGAEEALRLQLHFDQLRGHFSDNVAITVTKFHHMGHGLKEVTSGLKEKASLTAEKALTPLRISSRREITTRDRKGTGSKAEDEFTNPMAEGEEEAED